MCKHNPVTLYQDGGQCVVCQTCGAVLSPWRRAGETGAIGRRFVYVLGAASFAVFPAFGVWWALGTFANITEIELQLFTGAAYLVAFLVLLTCFCLCAVASEPDHEGEVE